MGFITSVSGIRGELRVGRRRLTTFRRWEAVPIGDGERWRLSVPEHAPDPLYWGDLDLDDRPTLAVALEIGRATHRGHAAPVSLEPLELEVWEMEPDA